MVAKRLRRCENPECQRSLPDGSHGNRKCCDERCAARKRYLEAKTDLALDEALGRVSPENSADGRASARSGDRYEAWVAEGWPERIHSGALTQAQVVRLSGVSQSDVSRFMAQWERDRLVAKRHDNWSIDPRHAEMLAPWLPKTLPEVRASHPGVQGAALQAVLAGLLDRAVDAFSEFRAEFFTDEAGRSYLTPEMHRAWILALLTALLTGGRLVILSPPRHGKSQLLVHFVVWLVCRFPNIRIIWVGGNAEIAEMMVGAVLDELENNELLIDSMLGPGGSFKPKGRSGKGWSPSRATVGTRTATGIKSPTIVALGKGAKVLSRDADAIVFDDVEDHGSVISPTERAKSKSYFKTQLSSRKEEYTMMAGIGSRQHHDDLWGSLVDSPSWASIVEHAHDPACGLPMHGPMPAEEHLECDICAAHVDCLLFPDLRSMRWLQDQRADMRDDTLFEMVYQNIARPGGADYLTVEHLRACRNSERRLGIDGLPMGCRLIAGLDPATSGFQASFLWGFDMESRRRYMVDIDNRRAGGLPGAEEIIKTWFAKYRVRTWVVESIYYQEAILQHVPIVEFCSKNGITLIPHITDRWNKWDRDFGVTAQFALFKQDPPLIDLPYGDAESIDKVRVYEQQLLNFEPQVVAARSRRPSDVLMAGWFPETQIRLWIATVSADVEHEYSTGYSSTLMSSLYEPDLGDSYGWSGGDQEAIVVGAA